MEKKKYLIPNSVVNATIGMSVICTSVGGGDATPPTHPLYNGGEWESAPVRRIPVIIKLK